MIGCRRTFCGRMRNRRIPLRKLCKWLNEEVNSGWTAGCQQIWSNGWDNVEATKPVWIHKHGDNNNPICQPYGGKGLPWEGVWARAKSKNGRGVSEKLNEKLRNLSKNGSCKKCRVGIPPCRRMLLAILPNTQQFRSCVFVMIHAVT